MRTDINGDAVTVTLSRRNLLALLHKLDMPESARTIYTFTRGGQLTVVAAEDDAEHYASREPGGEMHPKTEAFIREQG